LLIADLVTIHDCRINQQSEIKKSAIRKGFRGVLSSIGWSRVSPAMLDGRGARRRQNPVSPFLARWRFHGASFSRKRVDASMNPPLSRVKRDCRVLIAVN
jgi:hypothetical protein